MAVNDKIKTNQTAGPHISTVIPLDLKGESTREKVKEITERLEQGISELFDSEKYKEYLTAMSKFHNYSFRNTMLILMQKPDASMIAGYGDWFKNFKRHVVKGEKGIKILAPVPYKKQIEEKKLGNDGKPLYDKNGKELVETSEIIIPSFKVTTVFDVSQTDGEEIPSITNQLTGSIEQYEDFFRALKQVSPVSIELEDIKDGANGYYQLEEKRIAIKNDLSELQTIKTAIHEIAHAKLHALPEKDAGEPKQNRADRRTREVQAESVAYTVCQHFGLDTSDYSFGYIAGWSSGRETTELKASLEVIRNTATEFITGVEKRLSELTKQQEQMAEIPKEPDKTPSMDEMERKAKSVKKPSIRKLLAENKSKTTEQKPKRQEELSL